MTPQQQQARQQAQQRQQAEQQAALAVAATLATAATVAAATSALLPVFAALGIRRAALESAVKIAMDFPPDRLGMIGPATAQAIRLNQMRRAQYVVAAAHRISSALVTARARREDPLAALRDAVTAEHRFYGQHMMAMWNRADSAAHVDSAAMQYGLLLGWYSVLDRKTSAECRHAAGRNFRADAMPLIGYPGMVHPHCRCQPGAPHPAAAMLPSAVTPARQPVLIPA